VAKLANKKSVVGLLKSIYESKPFLVIPGAAGKKVNRQRI